MKNKIVRIVVVFCCVILLVCPLFTVGVSAYNLPNSVFLTRLYNDNDLPFNGCVTYYNNLVYDDTSFGQSVSSYATNIMFVETINGVQYINSFLGQFSLTTTNLNDGVYLMIVTYQITSNGDTVAYFSNSSYNITDGFAFGTGEFFGDPCDYYLFVTDEVNNSFQLEEKYFGTNENTLSVLIYDLGVPLNGGGGTPTECPTLEEQIRDYNGTWANFQGMMSTNSTLYEDFLEQKRIAYNDGIDVGQQDIINSINADNDFLSLMDTFLNYGMNNTRSVIENQMDTVYQNGIARGNEDGFNDGYNRGYNKGTSEVFGENLIGETFNAPLDALNQWVLFETVNGFEVTMGGIFSGLIALSVLIILIKMFAGG